jgi:hypothetical protein
VEEDFESSLTFTWLLFVATLPLEKIFLNENARTVENALGSANLRSARHGRQDSTRALRILTELRGIHETGNMPRKRKRGLLQTFGKKNEREAINEMSLSSILSHKSKKLIKNMNPSIGNNFH